MQERKSAFIQANCQYVRDGSLFQVETYCTTLSPQCDRLSGIRAGFNLLGKLERVPEDNRYKYQFEHRLQISAIGSKVWIRIILHSSSHQSKPRTIPNMCHYDQHDFLRDSSFHQPCRNI
jgi:hypothetical protein